jgi:hypothetical protein
MGIRHGVTLEQPMPVLGSLFPAVQPVNPPRCSGKTVIGTPDPAAARVPLLARKRGDVDDHPGALRMVLNVS